MVTTKEKINKLIEKIDKNNEDIKNSLEELKSEIEIGGNRIEGAVDVAELINNAKESKEKLKEEIKNKESEIQELKQQLEIINLSELGIGVIPGGIKEVGKNIIGGIDYVALTPVIGGTIDINSQCAAPTIYNDSEYKAWRSGGMKGLEILRFGGGKLAEKVVEVESKDEKINRLEKELKEKDAKIEELKQVLAKKEVEKVQENLMSVIEMMNKGPANKK